MPPFREGIVNRTRASKGLLNQEITASIHHENVCRSFGIPGPGPPLLARLSLRLCGVVLAGDTWHTANLPEEIESSNVSRGNVSREVGRTNPICRLKKSPGCSAPDSLRKNPRNSESRVERCVDLPFLGGNHLVDIRICSGPSHGSYHNDTFVAPSNNDTFVAPSIHYIVKSCCPTHSMCSSRPGHAQICFVQTKVHRT